MIHQAVAAAEQATTNEQVLGIALVIGIAVIAVAFFVFFLAALISVLGSKVLSGGGKILWVLVVFAFPFLGPLGWFIWGRNQPTYLNTSPTQGN